MSKLRRVTVREQRHELSIAATRVKHTLCAFDLYIIGARKMHYMLSAKTTQKNDKQRRAVRALQGKLITAAGWHYHTIHVRPCLDDLINLFRALSRDSRRVCVCLLFMRLRHIVCVCSAFLFSETYNFSAQAIVRVLSAVMHFTCSTYTHKTMPSPIYSLWFADTFSVFHACASFESVPHCCAFATIHTHTHSNTPSQGTRHNNVYARA